MACSRIVTLWLALLISLAGCQSPEETAQRKLRQWGIPYDEETFTGYVELKNAVMVDLFLAAGMNPNAKDKNGWTALMLAVQSGSAGAVQALLDKGADVNAKSKDGLTALMLAPSKSATVQALLDKGAVK